DLSKVWTFVDHNREARAPPMKLPKAYRPTGIFFPGLEAKAWWDRRCSSDFPWLADLEASYPEVLDEMLALTSHSRGNGFTEGSGEMTSVYGATNGWDTMRFSRYGQPGIDYSLLPRTLTTLEGIPLAPETVAFQRQQPGTGLPAHVDPSNFVLGCHLGLIIPGHGGRRTQLREDTQSALDVAGPIGSNGDGKGDAQAWIEVAGDRRYWEPGKAFVFDPSFVHETFNPCDSERVILNIDVYHPALTQVERGAVETVCDLIEQW
ncbi:unnamed protein product, partial [Discosporangium mesarthrocarpum]